MQKFKFFTLAILAMLSVNFAWGAEDTATGSSTLQAATTYYDLQSGKLIECKNSASNSYSNPVRIYANNTFTFHCKTGAEKITKIVIAANSNDYATITKDATWSASGTGTCSATATVSSSTVTVTVTGTATTVTCKPSSQVRWNSATVTYTTSGGGGGGGGGGETSATYVKATSLSDLCVGAKVIIAASGSNVAMSEEQKTNNRGQYTITKNGNNATWTTGTTDVEEFTLGKTGDYYTFKDKNNQYIYAASSSSNYLRSQATNNANGEWAITFSSGNASIVSHGSNTNNIIRYNSSSSLFACYGSTTQGDVAIYVKDGDCSECTAISPTLSYTAAATVGQVLNPTLDKKGSSGAVTYSIKSGSSYASINASTGALTCSAAGTVTVQATIAAAGDYCEGTATSNTITISAPSYTVTAQSNNTELGTVSGTTTITASPKTCVGYANPAYTVTPAGKATVAQNGNTFTVSNVTANVTVTINFVALTPDIYEDHLHNNAKIEKCGSYEAPSLPDATKATTGDCDADHYHFAGWVTSTISTGTTDAPSGMITTGTAMNANGRTYIAVWAKEQ